MRHLFFSVVLLVAETVAMSLNSTLSSNLTANYNITVSSETSTAVTSSSSSNIPLGNLIAAGLGLSSSSFPSTLQDYSSTSLATIEALNSSAMSSSAYFSTHVSIGTHNIATGTHATNVASVHSTAVASFNSTTVVPLNSTTVASLNSTAVASPNSTAVVASINLASTGTGSVYASECNAAWSAYMSASYNMNWTTYNSTSYFGTTNYSATVTTDCLSMRRIVGTLTPTASGTASFTFPHVTWDTHGRIITPTCSISPGDCEGLFSTFDAARSRDSLRDSIWSVAGLTISLASDLQSAQIGDTITTFDLGNPATPPILTINSTAYTANAGTSYYIAHDYFLPGGWDVIFPPYPYQEDPKEPVCNRSQNAAVCQDIPCTIMGGNVQLIYFPVLANASRDLCAMSPGNITTCPYGSATGFTTLSQSWGGHRCLYDTSNASMSTSNYGPSVVVNGTTFYENKAYISIEKAFATNSCGQLGSTHPGAMLTMASSDIFSVRGYHYQFADAAYSFNFADLNYPVPASAWNGVLNPGMYVDCPFGAWDFINGESVNGPPCTATLYDPAYNPVLFVPPQIRGMDPAWATCELSLGGFYDPPHALQPATTVDAVSVTTTAATPASSLSSVLAPQTSVAIRTSTRIDSSVPSLALSVHSSQESYNTDASVDNGNTARPPNADTTADSPITNSPSRSSQGAPPSSVVEPVDPTEDHSGQRSTSGSGDTTAKGDSIASAILSVLGVTKTKSQPGSTVGSFDDGEGVSKTDSSKDPSRSTIVPDEPMQSLANNPVPTSRAQSIYVDPFDLSTTAVGETRFGDSTVEGTTIAQDGSAASISPIAITAASGERILGGQGNGSPAENVPLDVQKTTLDSLGAVMTIGNEVVTMVSASSGVIVGDFTTLSEGGPAATIDSHIVSIESQGIIVASSTVLAPDSAVAVQPTQIHEVPVASIDEAGNLIFGTASILPGSEATISGQTVHYITSDILKIGTSTVTLLPSSRVDYADEALSLSTIALFATPAPGSSGSADTVVTIDGETFVASKPAGSPNIVVIGPQTLTVGGMVGTVNGQAVSAYSGGIILGSGTESETLLTVAGHTYTASINSASPDVVVFDSHTLTVGGNAATIYGVVLDAQPSGIVVGSSTLPLFADSGSTATSTALFTLAGQSYTAYTDPASNGVVIFGSQTLTVGGSAVTISGVPITAYSEGLIVGTSTIAFSAALATATKTTPVLLVTIAGQPYTGFIDPATPSAVILGSRTLTIGGSASMISGVVISAGSGGIVVGGSITVPFTSILTATSGSGSVPFTTPHTGSLSLSKTSNSEASTLVSSALALPTQTTTSRAAGKKASLSLGYVLPMLLGLIDMAIV